MNVLGCSDHAVVEFAVLRQMGEEKSKGKTLNFREVNFQHFKEVINKKLWETALRDKDGEQRWKVFKDSFHRVQECKEGHEVIRGTKHLCYEETLKKPHIFYISIH